MWVLSTHRNMSSFCNFSIETPGFYALMQLIRKLHHNCCHQKHFVQPQVHQMSWAVVTSWGRLSAVRTPQPWPGEKTGIKEGRGKEEGRKERREEEGNGEKGRRSCAPTKVFRSRRLCWLLEQHHPRTGKCRVFKVPSANPSLQRGGRVPQATLADLYSLHTVVPADEAPPGIKHAVTARV